MRAVVAREFGGRGQQAVVDAGLAAPAHRILEGRHSGGKIILDVAGS